MYIFLRFLHQYSSGILVYSFLFLNCPCLALVSGFHIFCCCCSEVSENCFNILTSYSCVCSEFLFLHDSVLVDCVFPGICTFHLSYLICWCTTVCHTHIILFIPVKSGAMSPFSFMICYLSLLSFQFWFFQKTTPCH